MKGAPTNLRHRRGERDRRFESSIISCTTCTSHTCRVASPTMTKLTNLSSSHASAAPAPKLGRDVRLEPRFGYKALEVTRELPADALAA